MDLNKTAILHCTCSQQYHDEKYGAGRRLMNQANGKTVPGKTTYRCSVCEKLHEV